VAVADTDPADEPMQRLGIRDRLFGAAKLGLGDDLEQRGAGAVEIDAGHPVKVLVQRLAGVLFEMRPSERNVDLAARRRNDADRPTLHDGNLVLADLISLGKVRIEVILAREHAALVDRSVDRESELDRSLDGPLV